MPHGAVDSGLRHFLAISLHFGAYGMLGGAAVCCGDGTRFAAVTEKATQSVTRSQEFIKSFMASSILK